MSISQRVYDPNDIARTTIKETNIHNNHSGNMGAQRPAQLKVYDPNDIARTTNKETNIHNNRQGNFDNTNADKPTQRNQDMPKITTKQTTIVRDVMGNYNRQTQGDAYKLKKIEVPMTNRDTTSTDYTGAMDGPDMGGYEVAGVQVPNTSKQFMSDNEYSGIMSANRPKAMSYADIYNATITSIREEVAVGREPTNVGPQKTISSSDIHATTNKLGDVQNKSLNQRGVMSTKVYNSIPQALTCGVTNDKGTLPNEPLQNRLDPSNLDAFRQNPYTQSLESHVFS